MTDAVVGVVLLLASLGQDDVHASYHGGACHPRADDGLSAEIVCQYAAAALRWYGHDPREPLRYSDCPGCVSKLNAVMGLLRCESGLRGYAYDEGYVAGTWNRSRGIAQIGDGWIHIATDAQAYDWRWSVAWLTQDLSRLTTRWYPECGR